MNHTRFANWVTIWVEHFPEWTKMGGPNYGIRADYVGRAIAGCHF